MSTKDVHIQRTDYFVGGDKKREEFLAEPACPSCGDCAGCQECRGCEYNWTPCVCDACKHDWTAPINGLAGVTKNAALYTKKSLLNDNSRLNKIAKGADSTANHNLTQLYLTPPIA